MGKGRPVVTVTKQQDQTVLSHGRGNLTDLFALHNTEKFNALQFQPGNFLILGAGHEPFLSCSVTVSAKAQFYCVLWHSSDFILCSVL